MDLRRLVYFTEAHLLKYCIFFSYFDVFIVMGIKRCIFIIHFEPTEVW